MKHRNTSVFRFLAGLALILFAQGFPPDLQAQTSAGAAGHKAVAKRAFFRSRKAVVKAAVLVLPDEGADRAPLKKSIQHLKAAGRLFRKEEPARSTAHSLKARQIARQLMEQHGGTVTDAEQTFPAEEEFAADVPEETLSREADEEEVTERELTQSAAENGLEIIALEE